MPPHPEAAPPARYRGVRNKARSAAGPGAAAMLAGEVNKGERPQAPRLQPGRQGALHRHRPPHGQCAGARCSPGAAALLRARRTSSWRPLSAAQWPHLPATEAAVLNPRAPPSRAVLPPRLDRARRRRPAPAPQPPPPPPAPSRTAHAHCTLRLRWPRRQASPPTCRTAQAPLVKGGARSGSPGGPGRWGASELCSARQ